MNQLSHTIENLIFTSMTILFKHTKYLVRTWNGFYKWKYLSCER